MVEQREIEALKEALAEHLHCADGNDEEAPEDQGVHPARVGVGQQPSLCQHVCAERLPTLARVVSAVVWPAQPHQSVEVPDGAPEKEDGDQQQDQKRQPARQE